MALGEPDPDAMLARMPARTFAEWQAYYRVEPWGEEIREFQFGMVCATIANSAPMGKKGRKPLSPEDFMPVARANKKAAPRSTVITGPDPKQVRADLISAFGDRIKRKGDGG